MVEVELLLQGCAAAEGTIIAPGLQSADPHADGRGPLRAHEPIVMDISPRHRSGYWADMTRTISKGEPPAPIARMYEIVCQAQDTAIAMVRPGVRGRDIHELVEDLIFEAGYDTARPGQRHSSGDAPLRGFTHGTGHGVGLEFTSRPASHVDALATCAWWQTMSSLWSQESMTPTSVA